MSLLDEADATMTDADEYAVHFARDHLRRGVPIMTTATSCAILIGRILGAYSHDPAQLNTDLNALFHVARLTGDACFKHKAN